MLQNILLVFHVLIAVTLVALVLLQQGKGADAGAAFGGGGGGAGGGGASGSVFGSKGSASFLSRTTGILAALFFITSLSLAYLANQQVEPKSVVDKISTSVPESKPAAKPSVPVSDVPVAE